MKNLGTKAGETKIFYIPARGRMSWGTTGGDDAAAEYGLLRHVRSTPRARDRQVKANITFYSLSELRLNRK